MAWMKGKRYWLIIPGSLVIFFCWLLLSRIPSSSILTGDKVIDSLLVANDRLNVALLHKDWNAIRGELGISADHKMVHPLAVDSYPDARRRGYVVTTFTEFRALAYSRTRDTVETMNQKKGLAYLFLPLGPPRQSYHCWIMKEGQWFLTDFDRDPYYEGSGRKRPTSADSGWIPIRTEPWIYTLVRSLIPSSAPKDRGRVQIPGTHVTLIPPEGFVLADSSAGFIHKPSGATIVAQCIPSPLDSTAKMFEDETQAAAHGMEVLRKEAHIDSKTSSVSLLIHARMRDGPGGADRWILAMGDSAGTVLISASNPATQDSSMSSALRASLLTARWGTK